MAAFKLGNQDSVEVVLGVDQQAYYTATLTFNVHDMHTTLCDNNRVPRCSAFDSASALKAQYSLASTTAAKWKETEFCGGRQAFVTWYRSVAQTDTTHTALGLSEFGTWLALSFPNNPTFMAKPTGSSSKVAVSQTMHVSLFKVNKGGTTTNEYDAAFDEFRRYMQSALRGTSVVFQHGSARCK